MCAWPAVTSGGPVTVPRSEPLLPSPENKLRRSFFDQNYYTFTLILLRKIVLYRQFLCTQKRRRKGLSQQSGVVALENAGTIIRPGGNPAGAMLLIICTNHYMYLTISPQDLAWWGGGAQFHFEPPWRQPRGKWMVSLVNSHMPPRRGGSCRRLT